MAKLIELYLRTSVIDQTRLTGIFNLDLKFHGMLSGMACRTCLYSDSTTPPSTAPDDGPTWPPVETAIQVLGLELKNTKASQVHIEMPVERISEDNGGEDRKEGELPASNIEPLRGKSRSDKT